MRAQQEIRDQIEYFKHKMQVLASVKAKEMLKPHYDRDGQFLNFVMKEQDLYAYALKQYEWLLGDHSAVTYQITGNRELKDLPGVVMSVSPAFEKPQSGKKKRIKNINILTWGGLGDALLATPAIRALKEKHPEKKLTVYCLWKKHREVFRYNPYIDSLKMASFWRHPLQYILFALKLMSVRSTNYSNYEPLGGSKRKITKIIGELLDIEVMDDKLQFFLSEDENEKGKDLLKNYSNPIAICPGTVSFKNKKWPGEKWEALISGMPDYTFIQLGTMDEPLLKGAIDLRDRPIRESVAVMKHSLGYVGVDSFFAHAAAAVDVPAVVLFGPTSPDLFGQHGNTNISRHLQCAPCMGSLNEHKCPYNRECMRRIEVREVKNALLNQIRKQTVSSYLI